MRRGRMVTALLGGLALAAILASAALGASPREIYSDYADNGRLDGQYSTADLERALQDAEAQGYPSATTPAARVAIQDRIGEQRGGVGEVGQGGTLPFTGLDLALLVLGAGFLLLLGWGFRRLGRTRA